MTTGEILGELWSRIGIVNISSDVNTNVKYLLSIPALSFGLVTVPSSCFRGTTPQ